MLHELLLSFEPASPCFVGYTACAGFTGKRICALNSRFIEALKCNASSLVRTPIHTREARGCAGDRPTPARFDTFPLPKARVADRAIRPLSDGNATPKCGVATLRPVAHEPVIAAPAGSPGTAPVATEIIDRAEVSILASHPSAAPAQIALRPWASRDGDMHARAVRALVLRTRVHVVAVERGRLLAAG